MSEQPQSQTPSKAAELAEVIAEFEHYRERLIGDTLEAAKKAKMPQQDTLVKLEPELAKIDAALATLRSQQAALDAPKNASPSTL